MREWRLSWEQYEPQSGWRPASESYRDLATARFDLLALRSHARPHTEYATVANVRLESRIVSDWERVE